MYQNENCSLTKYYELYTTIIWKRWRILRNDTLMSTVNIYIFIFFITRWIPMIVFQYATHTHTHTYTYKYMVISLR
jgi:hypothetical protein